jgi:hypothetical protein
MKLGERIAKIFSLEHVTVMDFKFNCANNPDPIVKVQFYQTPLQRDRILEVLKEYELMERRKVREAAEARDSLLKERVALMQHLDHLEEENESLRAEIEENKAVSIRHVLLQCAETLQNLSDENRKIAETKNVFYTRKMIMKAAQTYKHCAGYLRNRAEDFKR